MVDHIFIGSPLEAKTDFEQIESKVGGTFNRDSAIVEGTLNTKLIVTLNY